MYTNIYIYVCVVFLFLFWLSVSINLTFFLLVLQLKECFYLGYFSKYAVYCYFASNEI